MIRVKFSQEEIEFLKNNYPTHGSSLCAKTLSRTIRAVQCKASSLGLKIENQSSILLDIHKNKTRQVNEKCFIENQKPIHAYILGWLWADGCLSDAGTSRCVRIKIQKPDGDFLKKTFLQTGNWRTYEYETETKPVTIITTNNRPLYEYLEKHNYKTKNKTTKILSVIPKALWRYWFRGFYEGDGCFYKKGYIYQLIFSGPINQNWTFLTKQLSDMGLRFSVRKQQSKSGSSSVVRITNKNDCLKFLSWIYDGKEKDGFFLPRKAQFHAPKPILLTSSLVA